MDYSTVKNAALGLLARREHSVYELRGKLRQKYPDAEPMFDEIVQELQGLGYLSDERFAQMYVRYRESRGFGPERVLRDLADKGVSSDLCRLSIEEVESWQETAKRVWQKKFGTPPSDYKARAKQIQFLRYRGFTHREIEPVLHGCDTEV